MEHKTQFTVLMEDGSEYTYTAEVTSSNGFANILLCDFNGYKEFFECRYLEDDLYVYSLDNIQQLDRESELYKRLQSIAVAYLKN